MEFRNFTNMSEGTITLEEEILIGLKIPDTFVGLLTGNLTTVFFPVFYMIIFIVGLPTNAMAIWVFLIRTKKKHPATILLTNLALADLLFIIWLPLKIHYHFNGNNWIFGEPLCKVLTGFFYGNMYCSTIFIACISVQRYWAVVHPLSHKLTNQVAVCVSVCVWVVVWLITIPLYLYDQTVKVTNLNIITCHDIIWAHQIVIYAGYFLTMSIVGYVVPCVVCVVAYVLTFRSLRRSVAASNSSKKKKKAIILMIIVLVIFLVCFSPSNIMQIVHYSLLIARIRENGYDIYVIVLCLSSLNSCLDPFMYYFISDEFRKNIKNMIKCGSTRSAQQVRVTFTPTSTTTSKLDHPVVDLLNTSHE